MATAMLDFELDLVTSFILVSKHSNCFTHAITSSAKLVSSIEGEREIVLREICIGFNSIL